MVTASPSTSVTVERLLGGDRGGRASASSSSPARASRGVGAGCAAPEVDRMVRSYARDAVVAARAG